MAYALLRRISDTVRKEFEYVGERFSEEARKINYGEIEPKNIYGKTSTEEDKFPMVTETDD